MTFDKKMNEDANIPRWPVPEMILLGLFPVLFGGPDAVQQVYGRLPHWMQFLLPFSLAGYVALSSTRLAAQAARAKAKACKALSGVCAVLGFLALVCATFLMFGLGAGPWAFGLLAIGIVPAIVVVYAKDIWRLSNQAIHRTK